MSRPVHPRVCGERTLAVKQIPRIRGSSPRVRGTDRRGRGGPSRPRFIPACAGNGSACERFSGKQSVHPRVCGERAPPSGLIQRRAGSSPRVRGTVGRHPGQAVPRRFIPACAGNGCCPGTIRSGSTVHPRVCGERHPIDYKFDGKFGSSPRVRGTGLDAHRQPRRGRFIPACAGNGKRLP